MINHFASPNILVKSNRIGDFTCMLVFPAIFPVQNVLLSVVVAIDNDESDKRNATVLRWI